MDDAEGTNGEVSKSPESNPESFEENPLLLPPEYIFAKEFVTAALNARKLLDNPGTLAKIISSAATSTPGNLKILDFVIGPIVKGANLAFQFHEENSRRQTKDTIVHALNEDCLARKTFLRDELLFIRWFVDAAVEIYFSFENLLDCVELKIGQHRDKTMGKTRVAQLAAQLCFRQLTVDGSFKNMTKVIGQLDKWTWDNVVTTLVSVKEQLVQSRLRVKWNGLKFKMNTYEFLQWPVPVWSSQNSSDLLTFKNNVTKIPDNQAIFLRRPINFERDEPIQNEGEKFVQVSIGSIKNGDKIKMDDFKWVDRSEKKDQIYDQLVRDPLFDSESAWRTSLDQFNKKIDQKLKNLQNTLVSVQKGQEGLKSGQDEIKGHVTNIKDILLTKVMVPSNTNTKKRIWFRVSPPVKTFSGRDEFLKTLFKKLSGERGENFGTISSQVKVVSGVARVGKTQAVLKYIFRNEKLYQNVIWIRAETAGSIETAFLKLAQELSISTSFKDSYEKSGETTQKMIKNVYKTLCDTEKSTLIVFDNAQEDFEQEIEKFVPLSVDPKMKHLTILVTSRKENWSWKGEKLDMFPLKPFDEKESLTFISDQLEIGLDSDNPEILEFLSLVGGFPLVLQQSLAVIKEEQKRIPYQLSDFIKDFKSNTMAIEKVQKSKSGKSALKLLTHLAFLYPEKIPLDLARSIFSDPSKFSPALKCLENFSLVKVTDDSFVSLSRTLQFVVLQGFDENLVENSTVISNLLTKCGEFLTTAKLADSDIIFPNFHRLVENPFKQIPVNDKFLEFVHKFSRKLWEAGDYSESLRLSSKVYENRREILGENHKDTLEAQHQTALQLYELGKYDEALKLNEKVLEKREIDLGPESPATLTTKHNMAIILRSQKKYSESLSLFQQVLEQRKLSLGSDDPETLVTQSMMALVYSDMGDNEKALENYEDLEKKRVAISGPDHADTLNLKHNKGAALFRLGRMKEAAEVFSQVLESRKQNLGENHPDTIYTMEWVAWGLEEEGRVSDGLKLRKQVLELRRNVLPSGHPDIGRAQTNLKLVEQQLSDAENLYLN